MISFKNAKFFDFRQIRIIKVRKHSSVEKGQLIGASVGLVVSVIVANSVVERYNKNYQPTNAIISYSSPGMNALGAYISLVPTMTSAGVGIGSLIGGHYPYKYEIGNRSSDFQSLKIELKKYEWYQTDKDTSNTK